MEKQFYLRVRAQGMYVLTKWDDGEKETKHTIENIEGKGRWIADGRYDVTNVINRPDGPEIIAAIVGER